MFKSLVTTANASPETPVSNRHAVASSAFFRGLQDRCLLEDLEFEAG